MDIDATYEAALKRIILFKEKGDISHVAKIPGSDVSKFEPGIFIRLEGDAVRQAKTCIRVKRLLSDLPLKIYWARPPT